ncbi:Probable carboxyvinyl-carboxyphosphonate phosphorylmutase [hydrothermal vent metagenome]|uniref:Probable carboxyvinyl-carboxyphosphonate phosphorylmutase n=1 Tax=hydrothermal vent metagenome TaxID=652676 RepID=A0A3B0ZA44_9ZZZZ
MSIFSELHQQKEAFHLGNVWDVQSALLFQNAGCKAIGTSSAAIAASLGYDDGEDMPFDDLIWMVKKIRAKVDLPLSVDIEGGYSREAKQIIENIQVLHQLGVTGINIEDSVVTETRELLDATTFSRTISKVKSHLSKSNMDIFLNIRTDPYILALENPLKKTLERIKQYTDAGADGIFVPCLVNETDITQAVQSTALPVNVMCMPNLPTFNKLSTLGVKRISSGPFVYNNTVAHLEQSIHAIVKNQSFHSLFPQEAP